MAQNLIDSTRSGAQADTFTDYSVDGLNTDAATGETEYEWINSNASQYLGYYKTIPELKIAIDTKARWTVGKGYESPVFSQLILDSINGFGKDTFNSILYNMIREYNIYGDAFAEIIKNKNNQIINLKPLDPSSIKIVFDKRGLVKRYEQISKNKNGGVKKFEPEEIFHLSNGRIADEVHGISVIDACEWIILARNEAMTDFKKLLHRNIYPVRVWKLDTDIPSQIETFKAKVAASKGEGEDIFIPKGTVETELVGLPENSSISPIAWINLLNQYFYQAVGVPQIVIGGAQELTQTAAQIAYLSFEQVIEQEQLYVEEQVLHQLNLEINLEFPASLQNNVLSDNRKDGEQQQQLNKPSTLIPPMLNEGAQ